MQGGDISNYTTPTLAFSYQCFLHPKWETKHERWMKHLPEWLLSSRFGSPLVGRALKMIPRLEGAPVIDAVEDRSAFKVACYDVVPVAVLPLVRAAMRRYFPAVELHLRSDKEVVDPVADLRADLLNANLDTYYTREEVYYQRLKYTSGLKVLYFSGWGDI